MTQGAEEPEDESEGIESQSESEQSEGVKETPLEESIIPASSETSEDSPPLKGSKTALNSAGSPEKVFINAEDPEKLLPIQGEALEGEAVQRIAVNGTKRLFKRPEVDGARADVL